MTTMTEDLSLLQSLSHSELLDVLITTGTRGQEARDESLTNEQMITLLMATNEDFSRVATLFPHADESAMTPNECFDKMATTLGMVGARLADDIGYIEILKEVKSVKTQSTRALDNQNRKNQEIKKLQDQKDDLLDMMDRIEMWCERIGVNELETFHDITANKMKEGGEFSGR